MEFYNDRADIYVPDGKDEKEALGRTTHMCIAAHQDDCEIMAYDAIAQCYEKDENWFLAVVLTDGGGSPRSGKYADYTNEQIHVKRSQEQRDAAELGKYSAVVQLAYSSADVRVEKRAQIEKELETLLERARPQLVTIHNLVDRHETHLGASLRAIEAMRRLPLERRPKRVIGMEVWRSLDWLSSEDRVLFDTSFCPKLAEGVLAAFASQCTPRKRFDLAALGRRLGNATFQQPREVDETDSCSIGMDLTPLIMDDKLGIEAFVMKKLERFANESQQLLQVLMKEGNK